MSGNFLLDTNAAIAYLAQNAALLTIIEAADEIFVPSVVLGELFYGAEKSGRSEANRRNVETLAVSGAVLNCDIGTAREYGRIRNLLRTKGRLIPHNDTWIAAIAMQHGLTVLTRDKHFDDVDGLAKQGW
ncbi:MAG: ribonuclease VapC2 [Chloroflexota bacterium]|jgi:tRNA(fMet)-specific endonuclease VapC|nr:MAG: ribonuclease VapC2 [Chloroflexota bacterium]